MFIGQRLSHAVFLRTHNSIERKKCHVLAKHKNALFYRDMQRLSDSYMNFPVNTLQADYPFTIWPVNSLLSGVSYSPGESALRSLILPNENCIMFNEGKDMFLLNVKINCE